MLDLPRFSCRYPFGPPFGPTGPTGPTSPTVEAAWISVTARIFQVVESFHKDELVFEASKADDKGVYHFHRQWSEDGVTESDDPDNTLM